MQQALPTHPLAENVKAGPKGGVPTVKSKSKKSKIPEAMLTLNYPLYACDFDPSGSNGEARLVVGGGGGSGKNGVGNKIVSIYWSHRETRKERKRESQEGGTTVTRELMANS